MTPELFELSPPRTGRTTTFYTTGYEQSTPTDFLARLQEALVTIVVDVRDLPLSRKAGFFQAGPSAQRSNPRDISYTHLRQLGAPRELRHALRAGGSWSKYVKGYERVLLAQRETIRLLCEYARDERVCLLCFERDPAECHRSLIAQAMETLDPKLSVFPPPLLNRHAGR